MPSVIEGYKGLSAYFNAWTGRDLSPESFRKWVERDAELKRIVRVVNGRPGATRYELDRWIAMVTAPRTKRKRLLQRAGEWVQAWLL